MSLQRTFTRVVARQKDQFYLAAWRWHFYAALYVIPFLLMLAITGTVMIYANIFEDRYGLQRDVSVGAQLLAVSEQARIAQAAVPGSQLVQYISPGHVAQAAIFNVKAEKNMLVTVDPYTGVVLGVSAKGGSLYALMDDIHGTLLLGDFGDRLIEIAASLALVLVITGLYMWWPRDGRSFFFAMLPNLRLRGRALMSELHVSVGVWMSVILVLFLVTGLAWTGVWGGKMMQAWSSFPAEKWDNVPLSDSSHATLNDSGIAEIPWGLEQTKLPLSKGAAGAKLSLDHVVSYARTLGFKEQFRINLPTDHQGVYTLSADSMDGDTSNPMGDRTLHIDQYTGEVLASATFDDYSLFAKFMAVGTAFHMGYMGLWNFALNVIFCLAMVFLSISGIVMWWQRRPANVKRLVAPQLPADFPLWKGAVTLMLVIALAFPMAGLTFAVVFVFDWLIISRVKPLARALR